VVNSSHFNYWFSQQAPVVEEGNEAKKPRTEVSNGGGTNGTPAAAGGETAEQ